MFEKADRLYHLPQTINDFLPRKERRKLLGNEILDLARLNWSGTQSERLTTNDHPASSDEQNELLEKTAEWYLNQYGTKIKPSREIFIGQSIRWILNIISLAFFNPGDVILIPNPGIWHYRAAAVIANAETVPYHLSERGQFKPAISSISTSLARLAKAMIINSPHNPTGAPLSRNNLDEILRLSSRENILLILDQAFSGINSTTPLTSFYSIPGGRKTAMEIYSYAYTFGRPLPSIGFAVGQPALIDGLNRVAAIFGQTITQGQVKIGLEACNSFAASTERKNGQLAENQKLVEQLCQKLRLTPAANQAGPFFWAKLPGRRMSQRFTRSLYIKCGILAVPGIAFGEDGEGYLRFSLTADKDSYLKALDASEKLFQHIRERKRSDG